MSKQWAVIVPLTLGLVAACSQVSTAPPAPTPTATPAATPTPVSTPSPEPPPDPRVILEASFAAMDDLESFHFELRAASLAPATGSSDDAGAGPPITLVGDFEAPDRTHIASSGIIEMEIIAIGEVQYTRSSFSGGRWELGDPVDLDEPAIFPRPWTVLELSQIQDLEYLGKVTFEGTRTHHLRGRVPEGSNLDLEGEGVFEVWVGVDDNRWWQARFGVETESSEGAVTWGTVLVFSAFGEPVSIEPPDEVVLTPSSEPGAAAGSGTSVPTPTTGESLTRNFRLSVHQDGETLGGEELLFSQVLALGMPVVLNFWAGLCPPCRAEMPAFQRIYDEYNEDFILLGIDVGPFTGLGTNEDGIRLLEELGITYPTASVPDDQLVRDYGVVSMPTTIFIAADRTILRRWVGPLNETTMEELVLELIGLSRIPTPTPTTPAPTPTRTPTPAAVPAAPAATGSPARECYDVRPELDGVEVLSVDPEPGTVLEVGSTVAITVQLHYREDAYDGGVVDLMRVIGTGPISVFIAQSQTVPQGEGTLTPEGTFSVPVGVSEVSIAMRLSPPPSAAYAAGYSCWKVLTKAVATYTTDLASD